MIRTYSELACLETFEQRFKYLELDGQVGQETFGFDRYLNQKFYRSPEWRRVRQEVILRDNGCDLGIEDRPIFGNVIIHHINPMSVDDIKHKETWVLDPDFLICTCKRTHDAIHYSDESIIFSEPIQRSPDDTCLWR